MKIEKKKKPKRDPANLESEDCDYIRDNCLVSSDFILREVVGARAARCFAEQYQPVSTGATRALSGLLLFGPSGTGKSMLAQAITQFIGGTFYRFSAADLPPNTQKAAQRIDALFDVALNGSLPAVIFIDECDTMLSKAATVRVGHFAQRFERFTDNLLVIGATNQPEKIAPKILTGRFVRKIHVDNPSSKARQAMIERQLAEEDTDHSLSSADLDEIVEKTAGRSGVNMELIISTAARHADGLSVTLDNFLTALEEEESDFDKETAKKNQLFDSKHGWHPQ